jgi:hypothetical protein
VAGKQSEGSPERQFVPVRERQAFFVVYEIVGLMLFSVVTKAPHLRRAVDDSDVELHLLFDIPDASIKSLGKDDAMLALPNE